jgi:uncharacterized membrane protein YeiH
MLEGRVCLSGVAPPYLNFSAIVVFARTGALASIRPAKDMDIIAVIILGVVADVGGGTTRDMILNFEVLRGKQERQPEVV